MRTQMKSLAVYLLVTSAIFAQTPPADLIEAARRGPASPDLKALLTKTTAVTQVVIWGQDYLLVAKSAVPVTVSISSPQRR